MAQFETSTINQLTQSDLRNLTIPVPPHEERNQIVAFLESATGKVNDAIDRAHKEINLIIEFRTRLIADVVTGKLDVREAEVQLPKETAETDDVSEEDDFTIGKGEEIDDLEEMLVEVEI